MQNVLPVIQEDSGEPGTRQRLRCSRIGLAVGLHPISKQRSVVYLVPVRRNCLSAFSSKQKLKGNYMLYTIAMVLVILWILGLVSSYTMGGFVHVLLVIAIIVVLLNVIKGRRLV
jgi:hypothetical protein